MYTNTEKEKYAKDERIPIDRRRQKRKRMKLEMRRRRRRNRTNPYLLHNGTKV